MNLSLFIAQLLGVAYLVIGVGMFVSPKHYQKLFTSFSKDITAMYLGGVFALLVGFFIVRAHNVWEGWPILVTIVGWISLVKGLLLLLFPAEFMLWSENLMKKIGMSTAGLIVVLIGVLFGYFGFLA